MLKTSENKLFFADVVPLVPFPYGSREVFSYLSESDIPEGSIVLAPFGPRTVRGVVSSCHEIKTGKAPSRFKHIREVLFKSFVTPEQMSLARSVSEDCLTPLGRTLRHFLPPMTKERTGKSEAAGSAKKHPLRLPTREKDAAAHLTKHDPAIPLFLEAPIDSAIRIVSTATMKLPKGSQALILVPEQIAIPATEKMLAGTFGSDRVAVLSSSLSPGPFFSSWERIRSGEARVILGTRQALFAPFRALGLVAILEESEAVGYKQWDMSPRYDARRVVETLAGIHGARMIFSGSSPSAESGYRIKKRRLSLLSVRRETRAGVRLVNMREERYKKNFSLFSAELKEAIGTVIDRGGKALLVSNRDGLDSFSVCEFCKNIPKCPDCDRALRSTRDGAFRCPSCAYKTKSFPRCEKCGSLSFKNVGSGAEKVAREAKRLFPSAKVSSRDEAATDSGIIIGTAALLNVPRLPEVALVAIMDADNFLSFPDFRGDERFVGMIRKASGSVSPDREGSVLIQTFHPERELFRALAESEENRFLEKLLLDRETLGYPPYRRMFRFIIKDENDSKAKEVAEQAFALLSEAFRKSEVVRILPPTRPLKPKTRGKYEWQIVLSTRDSRPFPEKARKIIISIPKSWAFDPDPLSLV